LSRKCPNSDTRLSKAEQVFRELFPPVVGDYVRFEKQIKKKHRTFTGLIIEVRMKKGIKLYTIEVMSILPRIGNGGYFFKPDKVIVKGHKRLKIIEF